MRAFEAALRHGSFKLAAAELGLTATAVSHQVARLEALLGRALFLRQTRRVQATEEARELGSALTPALDAMADAFAAFGANRDRRTVTLGAGALFASRWLVPRLGSLWRRHPHIDLRLHHSPLPVHTLLDECDLAVAWGRGDWPGVDAHALLRIEVTPVLTPACLAAHGALEEPGDLLSLPLLHHRDQQGWRQWLAAAGVALPRALPGVVFADANVLLQAVLADQGVGLGTNAFVSDELCSGRLLRPFRRGVDPGSAYFLISRPGALEDAATRAVHDWLLAG